MGEFFTNWRLWIEAVTAAVLIGGVGGMIGVFIISRRVVFISMALSQVSALGVAAAMIVGERIGHSLGHEADGAEVGRTWLNPSLWSLVFAVAASLLLGSLPKLRKITSESLIGLFYLIAGGLVLIIASQMAAHAHEIDNILFGNAVAITASRLAEAAAVLTLVVALFAANLKKFLFLTFDEEAARAAALPVRRLNLLFYFALAAFISYSTRTIGGLPVFAFIVLPALGALGAARTITGAFILSVSCGMFSAFLGYLVSFLGSLPTGACMVMAAGVGASTIYLTSTVRRA